MNANFSYYMRNIRVVVVAALISCVATIWLLTDTSEPTVSRADAVVKPDRREIWEIVDDQINAGNMICPDTDQLTRVACGLYQGALGVWASQGKPQHCLPASAIDEIQEDIRLNHGAAGRAQSSPCFQSIYAIKVANVVPVLVSTSKRHFALRALDTFVRPGSDAEQCLIVGHGICGNQAATGIELLRMAGIPARSVKFFYTADERRKSHIVPEAFIDGRWIMVDTTFGAVWVKNKSDGHFALVSTEELIHKSDNSEIVRYKNSALLPYFLAVPDQNFDAFDYLTSDADIIRGEDGVIHFAISESTGIEEMEHRPNYIGDNSPGRQATVRYKLQHEVDQEIELTIRVAAAAIAGGEMLRICLDENCKTYSAENKDYTFLTNRSSKLKVASDADVAYVVLESMRWAPANQSSL